MGAGSMEELDWKESSIWDRLTDRSLEPDSRGGSIGMGVVDGLVGWISGVGIVVEA